MRVEFCGERPEEGGTFFVRFVPSNEQRSALDPDWFPSKNARQKRRCRPQIKLLKFKSSLKI